MVGDRTLRLQDRQTLLSLKMRRHTATIAWWIDSFGSRSSRLGPCSYQRKKVEFIQELSAMVFIE